MKLFILLLLLGSSLNSQSQQILPEFNEKPVYFDSNSHRLVDLEKSQYNKISKTKGLFEAEAGFFMNGATSTVKIAKNSIIKFIIKVNPGIDPTSILDLVRFEIQKDKRIFITTKSKTNGTITSFEKINYGLEKIKEGYYYLVVKDLENGEYFFGSNDFMYAFKIE